MRRERDERHHHERSHDQRRLGRDEHGLDDEHDLDELGRRRRDDVERAELGYRRSGRRAPCAGCTAVASLPLDSAPYGLAVDENNVYWTNSGSHEVMEAKADGSSPLVLATMQNTPYAVHLAGGFVYWTSYSVDGVMRKTPIGGGAITDLVDAPATRDFAIGTTHIWWTREPDDVQRIPIGGGAEDAGTVDLLTNNPLTNGITADATSIYWVNRQDGYIKRADLDFGFETPLAAGDIPWHIEVDDTFMYWTEQGSSPARARS